MRLALQFLTALITHGVEKVLIGFRIWPSGLKRISAME
jgi:hypothetical protein